jgi:hypothetical protein
MRQTILFLAFLIALAVGSSSAFSQEKEPAKKRGKQVAVGRNIFVEIENKKVVRVLIHANVCLREGMLEHLLTRRRCKEHESILAADIDARDLHKALLLAGLREGKPIVFKPKEVPPSGAAVKITLAYKKDGKDVKVPARQWIRHAKTKKDLHTDWVFVGSRFMGAEDNPAKVHYLANDGDVICVANFEAALLDVPILSTASGVNDYEAHTERIPPVDTPVLVILEPVQAKKK